MISTPVKFNEPTNHPGFFSHWMVLSFIQLSLPGILIQSKRLLNYSGSLTRAAHLSVFGGFVKGRMNVDKKIASAANQRNYYQS